eukprot:4338597-Pleurochrysis_carterae.AAC.3
MPCEHSVERRCCVSRCRGWRRRWLARASAGSRSLSRAPTHNGRRARPFSGARTPARSERARARASVCDSALERNRLCDSSRVLFLRLCAVCEPSRLSRSAARANARAGQTRAGKLVREPRRA